MVTVLNRRHLKWSTLSSSLLTGQGSEFHTTSDEVIKGDPSACAEAFHDDIHGLRAQIITCTQTWLDKGTFTSGDEEQGLLAVPREPMAFWSSWASTVPLRSWSYVANVDFQAFRTWQSSLNS